MRIILANVPPWYPNQPYLSVPLLTGIFRQVGHEVRQVDLNALFYATLLLPEELRPRFQRLERQADPSRKVQLLLELRAEILDRIEDATGVYRDQRFFDPTALK